MMDTQGNEIHMVTSVGQAVAKAEVKNHIHTYSLNHHSSSSKGLRAICPPT